MARTRPLWVIFEGGPMDGQKQIIPPNAPPTFRVYRDAGPGMVTPHQYTMTDRIITRDEWQERQRAAGNPWAKCEGGGRLVRFVRTLPDEPVKPLPRTHSIP